MADSDEQQVSSTTLFNEEVHHYQAEPRQDPFSVDDIVDLVGGAQDALERHMAEDTQTSAQEPVTLTEPEPEPLPEPVLRPEPQPEPELQLEPEPEPVSLVEQVVPDSTTSPVAPEEPAVVAPEVVAPEVVAPEPVPPKAVVPEPVPPKAVVPEPVPPKAVVSETVPPKAVVSETVPPKAMVPEAEPEITKLAPEPQAAPAEEPAPEKDALPAPEPAPAEAEKIAETVRPPAPVSDEHPPPVAQPRPLMQFPSVVDLLYWRDVKTTGVVFGAALLLLLSLTVCSIVSVCSYIGLALLSVTVCFRIYRGVLQAIQKSDEGHPFKQYLDQEVALSEEMVHKYSDLVLARLNKTISDMRRLFLVEDLVDSIKFAVLMWVLTYVGALFNGLTLIILGLVAVFSCPIVYEKHQAQIDHYLSLVNNQIKDVVGKIQAKVPGMKRKTE